MRPSQIIAVGDIEMQAAPGTEEDLIWLFHELIGLDLVESTSGLGNTIRFKSGNWEIRYSIVENPNLSAVQTKALLEVESLLEIRDALLERKIEFETFRGLRYTDQRLAFLDPAGNRIEVKKNWPEVL